MVRYDTIYVCMYVIDLYIFGRESDGFFMW